MEPARHFQLQPGYFQGRCWHRPEGTERANDRAHRTKADDLLRLPSKPRSPVPEGRAPNCGLNLTPNTRPFSLCPDSSGRLSSAVRARRKLYIPNKEAGSRSVLHVSLSSCGHPKDRGVSRFIFIVACARKQNDFPNRSPSMPRSLRSAFESHC